MSDWLLFASRPDLDAALAERLAEELRADLARRERSALAVSGGSTPEGMFQRLAAATLCWDRVDITLVDERWVDPASPDSNEALLRRCLLQGHAAAARLVGLKIAGSDCEAAVAAVAERLADLPRPFASVVLGMGADGHTASWFPGAANLEQLLDPASPARVAATRPPAAPHSRMTLTLGAVLDSRQIHIHIAGHDKRAVLESALANRLPIAPVLAQTATPVTIWWSP